MIVQWDRQYEVNVWSHEFCIVLYICITNGTIILTWELTFSSKYIFHGYHSNKSIMWIFFLQISYVSLLDIWMVSCIAFITLVLLEFPIVHTLIRKDKKPLAAKVENCALLIIPVMFAIYNIIYWSCLIYGWLFIISSESLTIQHAWNWSNFKLCFFWYFIKKFYPKIQY